MAVGGWVDARPLEDDLAARLAPGWSVEKRYYSDAQRKSDLPPSHAQAKMLFNSGVGLIVHAGHGESDGWAQCFSVGDLRGLTNSELFPVVISAGCSTAHFATLPPYEPYRTFTGRSTTALMTTKSSPRHHHRPIHTSAGDSIRVAWARRCCAARRTGRWPTSAATPAASLAALTLVDGFVGALAQSSQPRLGDCWASAVNYYYDREHLATLKPTEDWYPPSIFFQAMKFMLFGDPSLRLPDNQKIHAQTPPDAAVSGKSVVTSPAAESPSRGVTMRDPSTIIKCKDEFWVFHTGRGLRSAHSKDLAKWERGPRVFTNAPDWIAQAVPENRGDYWAPDIIHLGNRYLLYYSASSFGKNTSAIGLATNPILDPHDSAYRWTDQGVVIQSRATNDFNTIDPAIFHDTDGSLWLTFGSYWSGIKMIQLDPQTGKRIAPDSPITSLAYNDSH